MSNCCTLIHFKKQLIPENWYMHRRLLITLVNKILAHERFIVFLT